MAMDLTHPRPQMNSAVYRQSSVSTNPNAGKRIYRVWKGSNKFFCGGRLVFGPDVRSLFLTLTLIICPVAVFCVFVGKHLMVEFPHRAGIAIVAAVVSHAFFVLVSLFLTSARDPGIVPRNAHPPEPDEEVSSSSDWSGSQTPPKFRLPRTKDITVNGVVVKVKYCDTCMLYRPPRCSHCSICNNCVERFDHHCPWVGQCIGQRNYPFFFTFVLSATLLCILVFAMSALHIKKLVSGQNHYTIVKALQKSPAAVFLMIYTFLASWFVGGLTVFHLYLIGTNQTTYENFRYRYDNRINPYNRGLFRNFKNVLCSGIPASKVNFRAKVPLEVPSVGNYTPKQRESMDILSPKFNNPHSKIEMSSKTSWAATAVGQNLRATIPSSGLPKDNKRMVPYDPTKSPANNYHRDNNWGRQSSNWGYSSQSLGLSPVFGPPGGAPGTNNTLPPYLTNNNNPSGFGQANNPPSGFGQANNPPSGFGQANNNPSGFGHANNPVFVTRGNNPVYVSHSNNHRVVGSQVRHSNQRASYQYSYSGTGK